MVHATARVPRRDRRCGSFELARRPHGPLHARRPGLPRQRLRCPRRKPGNLGHRLCLRRRRERRRLGLARRHDPRRRRTSHRRRHRLRQDGLRRQRHLGRDRRTRHPLPQRSDLPHGLPDRHPMLGARGPRRDRRRRPRHEPPGPLDQVHARRRHLPDARPRPPATDRRRLRLRPRLRLRRNRQPARVGLRRREHQGHQYRRHRLRRARHRRGHLRRHLRRRGLRVSRRVPRRLVVLAARQLPDRRRRRRLGQLPGRPQHQVHARRPGLPRERPRHLANERQRHLCARLLVRRHREPVHPRLRRYDDDRRRRLRASSRHSGGEQRPLRGILRAHPVDVSPRDFDDRRPGVVDGQPLDARDGAGHRGTHRSALGRRTIHRLRAEERGLRRAAGRHALLLAGRGHEHAREYLVVPRRRGGRPLDGPLRRSERADSARASPRHRPSGGWRCRHQRQRERRPG
mmetsp:Transcript_24913/g.80619  ORF Transcript_24913/g.80619 Transcript_24913/m.80619 type:complete len:459 (+) Transcript_24913:1285-2661(+)